MTCIVLLRTDSKNRIHWQHCL